jgi:hypothetical protein
VFGSRKSMKQVDAALSAMKAALASEFCCHGANLFLYAEVTAGSVEATLVIRHADGHTCRIEPPRCVRAHLREIWTQFRIARLPVWSALCLTMDAYAASQINYVYADSLDLRLGVDQRAKRWLARTLGADVVAGLAAPALAEVD